MRMIPDLTDKDFWVMLVEAVYEHAPEGFYLKGMKRTDTVLSEDFRVMVGVALSGTLWKKNHNPKDVDFRLHNLDLIPDQDEQFYRNLISVHVMEAFERTFPE